jgi:hypothetical protein
VQCICGTKSVWECKSVKGVRREQSECRPTKLKLAGNGNSNVDVIGGEQAGRLIRWRDVAEDQVRRTLEKAWPDAKLAAGSKQRASVAKDAGRRAVDRPVSS